MNIWWIYLFCTSCDTALRLRCEQIFRWMSRILLLFLVMYQITHWKSSTFLIRLGTDYKVTYLKLKRPIYWPKTPELYFGVTKYYCVRRPDRYHAYDRYHCKELVLKKKEFGSMEAGPFECYLWLMESLITDWPTDVSGVLHQILRDRPQACIWKLNYGQSTY